MIISLPIFSFTELFRNIYVRVSIFYRCIVVKVIFLLWLDFKHICKKVVLTTTLNVSAFFKMITQDKTIDVEAFIDNIMNEFNKINK